MYSALVVDDDPHVCALAARALAGLRFRCATASDGDQALEAYLKRPCDVVVTDLRMPRRHGHALAVELLRCEPRPKIVVLTGLLEPKLAQDLAQRGVDEFVQKPANFDSLAKTVLRLVDQGAAAAPQPMGVAEPADPSTPQGRMQILQGIEGSLLELTDLFADRLAGVFDGAEELSAPPPAVKNFITRQAEIEEAAEAAGMAPKGFRETRAKARARCDATAVAAPVDRDFVPCGEPFKLAVRDVSESGLRLLHTRSTNAKHLALSWGAQTQPLRQLRVVGKVMRCRPLSPFYDIGCQFELADR